jgi:glycosyltransferase involved in cell wall biosynthesis
MSAPPAGAILSFTRINMDARVLRQVRYLSRDYPITVVGFGQLGPGAGSSVSMLPMPLPQGTDQARKLRTLLLLSLGRVAGGSAYEAWYWGRSEHRLALDLLLKTGASFIHANDWDALPVAVRAAEVSGAQVVFDAHEYSPLEREEQRQWRLLHKPMIHFFLTRYLSRCAAGVTVSDTIAERYGREYGFRPTVVRNIPEWATAPSFRPVDLGQIRLIHHGNAMRNRHLELLIETVAKADPRYTLHLMLIEATPGYIAELQAVAQSLAPGRVFFYEPVPPREVVGRLAQFDMGIYLLPFTNFNNASALPNKFFDFVAAGLAVCIGPSPEMAQVTRQYGFGAVAASFDPAEAAAILNSLSAEDIDQMKQHAIAARSVLNADAEMQKLTDLYAKLAGAQHNVRSPSRERR